MIRAHQNTIRQCLTQVRFHRSQNNKPLEVQPEKKVDPIRHE